MQQSKPPPPHPPLLSVAEAQSRLFALATPVATKTSPLGEVLGHYTGAPIVAKRYQPAADLSAMDGYAIRFDDLPGPWTVIGESAAGHPFTRTCARGEAVRIFTGASLPTGSDTIVIQEDVGRTGDQIALTGNGPAERGRHVRHKGMDFAAGKTLISAGAIMTPARIALAAAAGLSHIMVGRKVRIALVATGDELVPVGAPVIGTQLPESNSLMLAAMIADLPVEIIDLGILPDQLNTLVSAFAAVDADILVTTGGASVGDHDLVRPALTAAGATINFWRIAMRPGKPMMAGILGKAVVLGLPGNPVSAFVTARLFLRPLVAALSGANEPLPKTLTATLGAALPANDQRQDYLRAHIIDGRVEAASAQDSSMLLTLAQSDCLILRPPHAPPAQIGDSVPILPLT